MREGETGPDERGDSWDDGLIARRAAREGAAADAAERELRGLPARRTASEAAAERLSAAAAQQDRPSGSGAASDRGTAGPGTLNRGTVDRGSGRAPATLSEQGSRRVDGPHGPGHHRPGPSAARHAQGGTGAPGSRPSPCAQDLESETLRQRLGALRELIGLSRTRLDERVLAEAGRVLDDAAARGRLPRDCTTVAIAGATGSGKSTLFNALAGARLSEAGTSRPTTAAPVAAAWEPPGQVRAADGLLDRLGIAQDARCRLSAADLNGLILIDLPDHDSAVVGHREQVDELLRLVDAVVWVVDPEKYADALLHERYLRPLAGYAEVTFVVLNQTDRLPGEAGDMVLDDLRHLLDEDGMALGEHGEPGARVMATSALTGAGVCELRAELGAFVADRRAAALRLGADIDGAVGRLRPVYADPGPGSALDGPVGLTDLAREDFENRLASAVGAVAAGQAAERAWLRQAEQACGTPWAQLTEWQDRRHARKASAEGPSGAHTGTALPTTGGTAPGAPVPSGTPVPPGVPVPPEVSAATGDGSHGAASGAHAGTSGRPRDAVGRAGQASVARPVVAQAVRELAEDASAGLPEAWQRTVRAAARRGAEGLPEALDQVLLTREAEVTGSGRTERGPRVTGPRWWTVVRLTQLMLLVLQLFCVVWLVGAATGLGGSGDWPTVALLLGGTVASPLLACACRLAARGPARAYGLEEERRLLRLAAGCGRARVLEPVASELLRYREVREQFVIASGDVSGDLRGL